MTYRPHGKHVSIDPMAPQALGICDYTGFVFHHKDLVRQMEWRGNALIWTGFLVGRPYADKPNPQLRPPILPPDPVPIKWARPQQPNLLKWSQNANTVWSNTTFMSWATWGGGDDGIQAVGEQQRLDALEQGGNVTAGFPGVGEFQPQPVPYQVALSRLQNAHWGGS